MRRRDDVAVFIRGQGHDLVHLFDRGAGETHPFRDGLVDASLDGLGSHIGPHRQHSFERGGYRSEEHTSELQSLMRISYAVFCLKKKTTVVYTYHQHTTNLHTYKSSS